MVIDRIADNARRNAGTWEMAGRGWVYRASPIGLHLPALVHRNLIRIYVRVGLNFADANRCDGRSSGSERITGFV